MPKEPGRRALARIWIDFSNTRFTSPFYKMMLEQDPEKRKPLIEDLTKNFEKHLIRTNPPQVTATQAWDRPWVRGHRGVRGRRL